MTTFEGSIPFNTMFSHPEDTEMVVDAGKIVQDGEDIDIDLDFEDYGNQDEMMMEEHHEPVHDMVLGDAVVTMEQDEVMTDDDQEEQIFDEEITDAPEELIEVKELELIPDAEYENEMKPAIEEPLIELDQQNNLIAENTELEGQAAELQLNPEALPQAVTTNPEEHIATQNEGNGITKSTKEEVEELITWESDDEEDDTSDPKQAKVGDSKEEQQLAELPVLEIGSVQESRTTEPISATLGQDNTHTTEPKDDANTDKHDTLATTIKYNVEQNDATERPNDSADSGAAIGNAHNPTTDIHTQPDQDRENDIHEAVPNDATIRKQALEQLHPINIRYMDEEMSLFPPTVEEEHSFFFLSEKKLAFDSCENLFKAFREVLHESIAENESLVLACPELGLDIHEGIPEASTLSVAQLLHLHLGLSHNDGHDQPSPMLLVLKHHNDVSGRLNHLYAILNSGKGFSAISGSSSSEQTHSDEHAEEAEEFGVEDHGSDVQSANDAHEVGASLNDDHGIQNGLTTPPHESTLAPENEELDFQSPAAVHKNSNPLKLDRVDEADKANPTTQDVGDDIAVQQADIISVQDVIDYDDDDEETLDGTLVNVEQDDDQSSSLPNVDPSQQTTNHETYAIPPVNEDTNHSNSNGGLLQVTDIELESKENFGSEDSTIKSGNLKASQINGKGNIGLSATVAHEDTDSNINQEAPTYQETSTTVEEFEEIGYSDDDEPLPEPAKQNSERQSPKRSFEDSDEPDRETKKLRSG